MLFNYLKLAIRLLLRNPFFTLINVFGLSIGFAAFYILWPYTQRELKSDQFHKDYEQIARLNRIYDFDEGKNHVRFYSQCTTQELLRVSKRYQKYFDDDNFIS